MVGRNHYTYLVPCRFNKLSLDKVPLLENQAVHLWWVDLQAAAVRLDSLLVTLAPDEQQRAERFRFAKDRQQFIAARGVLRLILAAYLKLEAKQLTFSYGSHGKPALIQNSEATTLQFNLSHAHTFALYAIARHGAIGVDLEYFRPVSDITQLAKRFFSEQEYTSICSLPLEQRQQAFFSLWTCREAYLKATGIGLTALEQVELACTGQAPFEILGFRDRARPEAAWSLVQFQPASDYIAALAVEGGYQQLSFWQL